MRALVTTSGDSARLPGPPPKSFRVLGGISVVARIVNQLEALDQFIDQIDVIVRVDHERWAKGALWGSECDIVLQPTLGLTERIRRARKGEEALIVCLGDTLVQDHYSQITRVIANRPSLRARVLADMHEARYIVNSPGSGLSWETGPEAVVDVGTYYIPEGFPLHDPSNGDESLMASLLVSGLVDPVRLSPGLLWRDVGTPEGFAAAEIALATGRL
jgi:hypothetical protein